MHRCQHCGECASGYYFCDKKPTIIVLLTSYCRRAHWRKQLIALNGWQQMPDLWYCIRRKYDFVMVFFMNVHTMFTAVTRYNISKLHVFVAEDKRICVVCICTCVIIFSSCQACERNCTVCSTASILDVNGDGQWRSSMISRTADFQPKITFEALTKYLMSSSKLQIICYKQGRNSTLSTPQQMLLRTPIGWKLNNTISAGESPLFLQGISPLAFIYTIHKRTHHTHTHTFYVASQVRFYAIHDRASLGNAAANGRHILLRTKTADSTIHEKSMCIYFYSES